MEDEFMIHKHSPRSYSFNLTPHSQRHFNASVEWVDKITSYLEKRRLIPSRVHAIIENDSEYNRMYIIEFLNTKDAFWFDIAFGEIIHQEYDQYG